MANRVKDLMTKRETIAAVRAAKLVLIGVKFGVYETEVKISKVEALVMLDTLSDNVTPEQFEMYTDTFGTVWDNGSVSLG